MATLRGIPIKDRAPADIKEALKDKAEEVIVQFLALHKYAQENKLGITALERQSGIASSIISQGFNGDYIGNYDAVAKRIETFFWRLDQKALYGGLRQFVETGLSNYLWKIYEKSRIIRRIQIVQSPEQVGKTRAAEEYADRNNSGRTVFFSFTRAIETMNDFIHCFSVQLGAARTTKLREKKAEISENLTACDLIILDEVHLIFKLGFRETCKLLDYIRTDLFQNGERGIVLQCTDDREVGQFMAALKHVSKAYRYNVGQFLGRMHNDVVVIDPSEDITDDDVLALVGRYYKPGKVTVRRLTTLAQAEQLGHFGLLDDIMTEAWTRSKARRQKELTDEMVETVAKEVEQTLKGRKELYE